MKCNCISKNNKNHKMKINISLVLVIIIVLFYTQAQAQGMYITAGGGYGFCAARVQPLTNLSCTANNNGSGYTINYNIVNRSGSYGNGIQVGAAFGYMFTENLGAELSVGYLWGAKFTKHENDINSAYVRLDEESTYGRMLRFIPAVRMTVGKGKLKPYMKTGLVIGACAKLIDNFDRKFIDAYPPINGTMKIVTEFSGGISLGFASGLGANYKFNDRFGVYMELGIITQSWAPKKSVITKYLSDDVDILSTLPTYTKETVYDDSYTVDTGVYDSSVPRKQLKCYFPFSSVGINVGLHISLGGKK